MSALSNPTCPAIAVFRCRACGVPLTPQLRLLADRTALCHWQEGEPYLPQGTFTVSEGDFGPAGQFVVHLGNLVDVGYHPERRRLSGCCGRAGCNGMNRVCREGHEVATECSDCWMAHAAHFDPAAVFPDPVGFEVNPSWLSWNNGTVKRLAESAYHEQSQPEGTLDVARLAVLADALTDAGCTDTVLLDHLRGPGPHVRGCWAIDRLLSKE
jgi:hypothetical protein